MHTSSFSSKTYSPSTDVNQNTYIHVRAHSSLLSDFKFFFFFLFFFILLALLLLCYLYVLTNEIQTCFHKIRQTSCLLCKIIISTLLGFSMYSDILTESMKMQSSLLFNIFRRWYYPQTTPLHLFFHFKIHFNFFSFLFFSLIWFLLFQSTF